MIFEVERLKADAAGDQSINFSFGRLMASANFLPARRESSAPVFLLRLADSLKLTPPLVISMTETELLAEFVIDKSLLVAGLPPTKVETARVCGSGWAGVSSPKFTFSPAARRAAMTSP